MKPTRLYAFNCNKKAQVNNASNPGILPDGTMEFFRFSYSTNQTCFDQLCLKRKHDPALSHQNSAKCRRRTATGNASQHYSSTASQIMIKASGISYLLGVPKVYFHQVFSQMFAISFNFIDNFFKINPANPKFLFIRATFHIIR